MTFHQQSHLSLHFINGDSQFSQVLFQRFYCSPRDNQMITGRRNGHDVNAWLVRGIYVKHLKIQGVENLNEEEVETLRSLPNHAAKRVGLCLLQDFFWRLFRIEEPVKFMRRTLTNDT